MSEQELIQRIRDGDTVAFAELYRLYSVQVVNTCYRFFLERDDAEDMAQEVFIEVYQSIHAFRGNSRLSTWIYRIAVTRSLDELRKRKRKKRFGSIKGFLGLEEIQEHISDGTTPDQELEHAEQKHQLLNALNRLPENQRVAFTLSKVDGYDNRQIADVMQTTVIAVETLISRAKKKMLAELERLQKK